MILLLAKTEKCKDLLKLMKYAGICICRFNMKIRELTRKYGSMMYLRHKTPIIPCLKGPHIINKSLPTYMIVIAQPKIVKSYEIEFFPNL